MGMNFKLYLQSASGNTHSAHLVQNTTALPPALLWRCTPTSRTDRWTRLSGRANEDAQESAGSLPVRQDPERDPQHLQGEGETRTRAGWHSSLPHRQLRGRSTPGRPGPVGSPTQRRGPLSSRLPAAREAWLIHPGFGVVVVFFFF